MQDPDEPPTTIAQLTVASAQSALACTSLGLPSGPAVLASVLPVAQMRELWLTVIPHHADDPPDQPEGTPGFNVDHDSVQELLRPMAGALETLVVWGHIFPTVLDALISNNATATRALCPKLSTLRLMLSDHSPPVQDLIAQLVVQQDFLRLKHVQVDYLPSYAGPRLDSLPFDHHLASIKYTSRSGIPMMTLPSVCREEAHARWGPWTVDSNGMYVEEDMETDEDDTLHVGEEIDDVHTFG